jgi:O-acetyl-ADP-ribose deacetylase (regulator of RNase III)
MPFPRPPKKKQQKSNHCGREEHADLTPRRHGHRKHVIHAVGPVYHPRSTRAPLQLAGCYRISLQLAAEHGLKHIVSIHFSLLRARVRARAALRLTKTHTCFVIFYVYFYFICALSHFF